MKSLYNKTLATTTKLGATCHWVFTNDITGSVQYITIVSAASNGSWTWTTIRYLDGTETGFVTEPHDYLWPEGGSVFPTAQSKMDALIADGASMSEFVRTGSVNINGRVGTVKVRVA